MQASSCVIVSSARRAPSSSFADSRSFPFESLLQAADFHIERTGLDDAFIIGADERQVLGGQFERNLAALAGLERHLRESLEPLQRWRHARDMFVQVQLDNFFACAVAGVLYRHIH